LRHIRTRSRRLVSQSGRLSVQTVPRRAHAPRPVSFDGRTSGARAPRGRHRNRRLWSRGRPGSRPVAACCLTRLPTRVELHDLRARHRLRPGSDPHEMEMHLLLLSVVGRLRRPRD